MAGILQAQKAGDALDMEGFGLSDKLRIRADIGEPFPSRKLTRGGKPWGRS